MWFWSRCRLRSATSWLGSSGSSAVRSVSKSFIAGLLGQNGGELLAGARQPGADRARGDAECFGDLRVTEVGEGHQQQDVAFAAGQPGQRFSQLTGHDDAVFVAFGGPGRLEPRERAVVPGLLAAVPRHEVRRDAEEPGPRVAAGGVERLPAVEGDQ